MRAPLPPTRVLPVLLAALVTTAGCFGQSQQKMNENPPPVVVPEDGTGWTSAPGEPLPPFQPAPLSIRRLLAWQYRAAVGDLLGTQAGAAVTPPEDTAVNGFDSIGAAQLALSPQAVDRYEKSAMAAAEAAFADPATRATLVPCTPAAADDASCLGKVIASVGYRAWRRPLTDDELSRWVAVGQQAGKAYGDFYKGAQFAVAGLIESPNFLYLVEVGQPDPADPSRMRLTPYELAARLAFFLNGTLPDAQLLSAAETGGLDTADGVRAQARRLLEKPEAVTALDHFFDEAFQLREVDGMPKDPTVYPEFTPALAKAMHEESTLLFHDVVWDRDADFREVLDSTHTFVNADLAQLYGMPAPAQPGFSRVELDPNGLRGGFLGQASFLALMAHPKSTSPTHRGRFVRERLLCTSVPAPPPNVNTGFTQQVDPNAPPMTMRERLAMHQQNPSCAGCHTLMDNVGLGLENFDAIGRFQDHDNGKPVDAVSKFDDKGTFTGALELGRMLRADDRVVPCLVKNVFRMGTGHVEEQGESLPLYTAQQAFEANGYRMKSLLVEIAASDAFRYGEKEVQP